MQWKRLSVLLAINNKHWKRRRKTKVLNAKRLSMRHVTSNLFIRDVYWYLISINSYNNSLNFFSVFSIVFAFAGSSTACVLILNRENSTVYTANIGDSGFIVVREGQIIHRSEEQQHYFNTPFQLSLPPPGQNVLSDSPESADTLSFPVQNGDVVLAATDGVFDNVPTDLLLDILKDVSFCQNLLTESFDLIIFLFRSAKVKAIKLSCKWLQMQSHWWHDHYRSIANLCHRSQWMHDEIILMPPVRSSWNRSIDAILSIDFLCSTERIESL